VTQVKFYQGILDFSGVFNFRNGIVSLSAGALGGTLGQFYGGELYVWFIVALALPVVFDWISGSIAAKKDQSYASAYGIQGLVRTAVLLAIPAWASVMDKLFSTNFLFFMFWGGILFHTLISMTANFKRIGWNVWIPTWAFEWVTSEIEAKIKRAQDRTKGEGQ
jgi:phage-related holin